MGERAGEDALSDNDCVDVADKTSVMQYQTWVHGRYGWPAEADASRTAIESDASGSRSDCV